MIGPQGQCESYSDPYFVLKYANFIVILLPLLLMFTGKYMKHTLKFVAYSQILSLLLFVNHPDFYRHKDMLDVYRVDNLAPIIPNIFAFGEYKYINDQYYVNVKNQIPPISFFSEFFSSNYLINLGPLTVMYALFILSIPFAWFKFRSTHQLSQSNSTNSLEACTAINKKKLNRLQIYIANGFITLFVITFQEEFMLICLQLQNVNFSDALNSLGFIMAFIGLVFHVIPMLGLYFYLVLLFGKQQTNQQKQIYGSFYDKTPFAEGFNTRVSCLNNGVYFIIKIFIVASIVDNRSTLNQVFYIISILALVANSFYQYIHHNKACQPTKSTKNKALSSANFLMTFIPDILMIMMIPCVIGIEKSRSINYFNFDSDKDLYKYILVYLLIFFSVKLIVVIADIYFFLTSKQNIKGKLISNSNGVKSSDHVSSIQGSVNNQNISPKVKDQNKFILQNQEKTEFSERKL